MICCATKTKLWSWYYSAFCGAGCNEYIYERCLQSAGWYCIQIQTEKLAKLKICQKWSNFAKEICANATLVQCNLPIWIMPMMGPIRFRCRQKNLHVQATGTCAAASTWTLLRLGESPECSFKIGCQGSVFHNTSLSSYKLACRHQGCSASPAEKNKIKIWYPFSLCQKMSLSFHLSLYSIQYTAFDYLLYRNIF